MQLPGYYDWYTQVKAYTTRLVNIRSVSPGQGEIQVAREVLNMLQEDRAAQAIAWRAVTDATRQQVAELSTTLQALDAKIASIERTPTVQKPARDDVVEGAKVVRKAVEAVKQTASVDVASLPLETVSAQAMNVTGFGKGVVGIGSQRLTVGQSLGQGETIVAIDMETHSIVTTRRIINVTN